MKSKNLYSYFKESFQKDHESYIEGSQRKTGFSVLDEQISLQNGLTILGAETGMGKTTFAVNLSVNLAEADENILYFSLEQGEYDFYTKVISILEAHEKDTALDFESLSAEDLKELTQKHQAILERIHIVQANFGITLGEITSTIDDFISTNNVKPIVFIDYLQIILRNNSNGSREGIDQVVSGLKQYQNRKNLCMIVISSLNRANYGTRLSKESFKESGNIEYDADMVCGLQLQILDDPFFDQTGQQNEKRKRIEEEMAQDIRKISFVSLKRRGKNPYFTCKLEFYPSKYLFRSEGMDDPFMRLVKEKNEESKEQEINIDEVDL